MDTVVGHYGYLEYISGAEFSTRFPHKIVSFARQIIMASRVGSPEPSTNLDTGAAMEISDFDIDTSLQQVSRGFTRTTQRAD
jgi:hypothetical protein